MPARIRNQLAQQIVDTLKTICSHDINFIDVQGRISASTDPARVGEYHFGGHNAAQSGQVIVIGQDDTLNSMRQGINMPIRFHGSTVAVIGITGEPEEVQKYADLAQRITLLLLREHEIDSRNYDTRTQTGYLVRALIDCEPVNPEFVSEVLERNGLSDKAEQWRAMVIQLKESHVHTLSAIEAAAQNVMKRLGSCLYAYRFPDEYVLIVKERDSVRWEKALRRWQLTGRRIFGQASAPQGGCHARTCPSRLQSWPSRVWRQGRISLPTNPSAWRSFSAAFRSTQPGYIWKNV